MSQAFSLGHRNLKLNSLFAGMACAITLTLTVGPALAAPGDELGRVEIQGRMVEAPVRYDVHASCAGIEAQLQDALQTTWIRERQAGNVMVQFVMEGGEINGVKARGISHKVEREVRKAVNDLQCGQQASAGTHIYRFRVDFIDPYNMPYRGGDTQTAGAQSGIRLALVKD
jgi:hypothetical protein